MYEWFKHKKIVNSWKGWKMCEKEKDTWIKNDTIS